MWVKTIVIIGKKEEKMFQISEKDEDEVDGDSEAEESVIFIQFGRLS